LKNYFSGKKVQFSGPFELKGTDFQKKVWKKMSIIPFGTTVTYSDLAHSIKSPKAVRAIGMTCGLNPIAIMIPCHRVIGKNGKLKGYAGGLETKKWLLELESNNR
jgi:methylated-DNA-[protein]-cysteine S-methyltransferase